MKTKKNLAIIAFSLVMGAILIAIISDIAIFWSAIINFIAGIFICCIAFLFLIIVMIITILFIFGVVLLKNEGFWPLKVASNLFHEIMVDTPITSNQISAFIGVRIGLIALFIAGLVIAIIALHKKSKEDKLPLKGLSISAFILAILGILLAASLLSLTLVLY